MFDSLRDVLQIIRIAGIGGFARLLDHSRRVKRFGAPFALMHCLIGLEKSGMNERLRGRSGLDIAALSGVDAASLTATCEYLCERNVLVRSGSQSFRVRNKVQFDGLIDAMHACLAYHAPVDVLDRLILDEFQYGVQVARDDRYDALASATLTSIFSYGFAYDVLAGSGATSLLDGGCGTGEFLSYLRRRGFKGRLYGMDLAAEAIEDGRSMGFADADTALFVGNALKMDESLRAQGSPEIDLFSFMFVLHEFSTEQITMILSSIRRAAPRSRILLTELERRTSEETRKSARSMLPELKFVHLISKQTLRSAAEWKELFASAGFTSVKEQRNRLTTQACFLFAPS